MVSYHINYTNGYGPYLKRHEYEGDGERDWEHLGPLHSVDAAQLPDDVVADIRSEGYGLARYRDGVAGELHDLGVANSARDELVERWDEHVLSPADDRRSTEVELASDAPRGAERVLGHKADEMEAEVNSGSGQAKIGEGARSAIDFTKTDIPTVRTHKAAIQDEGIDDWMAVWSEDISTVGEAREAARRNRESISGKRMDNNDEEHHGGATAAGALDKMEKQALEGAREGYDEAREALVEHHGWSEDEVKEAVTA